MPWTRTRIVLAALWLVIVGVATTALITDMFIRIVVGIVLITMGAIIIHRIGRRAN